MEIRKQFTELVADILTDKEIKAGDTSITEMVDALVSEYQEFSNGKKTVEEWFSQELPFLREFGMTALNCGLAGKKLSSKRSEEPFDIGLSKLNEFLGEQMQKLELVRKGLDHKANKEYQFQDYSHTMWKWCLNWSIHREYCDQEKFKYDHLLTDLDKLSSADLTHAQVEQNIRQASMAFNLMMNNYEGAFDMERESLLELTDHLMKDMLTLNQAFQLWIYG